MTSRIVGRKIKPDGDPVELFRFDTGSPPMHTAQRFAFGYWRDNRAPGAPSIATLISGVQRGQYVDLPIASFETLDAGSAKVERFTISYPVAMLNSIGSAPLREKAESWDGVVGSHPAHLIAQTRFTLGTHSWWVIERGEIEPVPGRRVIESAIGSNVQASIFSVEPAARKGFTQWVTERERGEERLIAFPATATDFNIENRQISAGLALNWMETHAAEMRKREEERKRAEAAERAMAEQRERERLIEEERQRRIASGDVTVLDDQGLAARLRAKRAQKGTTT